MDNAAKDAILARLTAEDSPHQERFIAAWTDHLLEQPIKLLIDPGELAQLFLESLTQSNVERAIVRHLAPSRARTRTLWKETRETPGDLLSPDAKRHLEALVSRTQDDPSASMRWAKDAVDPALVRELMSPVLQDILLSFARRLPRPSLSSMASGDGAAAKVAGRLGGLRSKFKDRVGKRAGQFASAGKSVLGGIGSEFEQKIQSAAGEFSESAASEIRASVRDRLSSDEGQELLAQIRVQLLQAFLSTPFTDLVGDVDDVSMDDLTCVLAPSAEHNRARSVFARGIRQEIEGWFDVEGERTLGALLEEAGLRELTRANLIARTTPVARSFFASDAFGAWLGDLMEGA